MSGRALRALWALWPLLCGTALAGQEPRLGSPTEAYVRLLQISGLSTAGSYTVRPLAGRNLEVAADGHPWSVARGAGEPLVAAEAALEIFANTSYPKGGNDGAVWQGRGLTSVFTAGVELRWRAAEIHFAPTLMHNQNHHFELAQVDLPGQQGFAYPWRVIDLPQRFGSEPFWTLDMGQSEIAVVAGGARLGFGTRNLWWGPGIENAIVMSDNAAGFPHASLSTARALDIGIGRLEAQWIWGRLTQSDYFGDDVPEDRFFTGAVLAYSPSFLAGLTVGGTRAFVLHVPPGGVPLGEYGLVFGGLWKRSSVSGSNPSGNDARNQLLSVFARWHLAESGFEVYGEWSRNDHAWSPRDLILEPEHSRGYTLGFQHVADVSADRLIAWRAEVTQLEASATFQLRSRGTYYEHLTVTQGYTHRGQVIGASVGPGGNAQSLAIEYYVPKGRASLQVRRQVHDNDAFWVWAEETGASFDRHNVSLDFGGGALAFVGDFELAGGIVLTREFNRYFYGRDGWNLNVGLSARWRPDLP